jgi:Glycosyl transferase family 2
VDIASCGPDLRVASLLPTQRTELTVLMPCLNEAETVATCVGKAVAFLTDHGIDGEVVVADNGSTDGSQRLAEAAGARVVTVGQRGYGAALQGGIRAARGEYVIMGDADDSYDFTALMPFVERLRAGTDLVMGNRFRGGIEPGAMPTLHRYLGNPVLSFVGRLFFKIEVGDFHCGLRGFRRDSALSLCLLSSGMEFASEMVVRAALAGQRVEEVPTTLSPDGRSRPPHLRSWRDGWRHLRFLLLFSPRWLFLIPGMALLAVGLVLGVAVLPGPVRLGGVTLDVDALAVACVLMVIGFQAMLCALFSQVHASAEGLLPEDPRISKVLAAWSLERGLLLCGLLAAAGLAGLLAVFIRWHGGSITERYDGTSQRIMVLSAMALIGSCQLTLGNFILTVLSIRRRDEQATVATDVRYSAVAATQAVHPVPRA